MNLTVLHRKWSSYAALIVWGSSGFMAQPTFASFMVHFTFIPLGLLAVIWLAHHEARGTL